jgi:hypothetical protein
MPLLLNFRRRLPSYRQEDDLRSLSRLVTSWKKNFEKNPGELVQYAEKKLLGIFPGLIVLNLVSFALVGVFPIGREIAVPPAKYTWS